MPSLLIPTPRGQMPCHLALPPTPGPAPGVVVLHDVYGMSQDHRNQAEWLAQAGFLALAVDLYYTGNRLLCVREVIRDLMRRTGPAFDDVEAARAWLQADPRCTGRIGVIGFCMGGGFALLLVSGRGFSAASVNYGGPPPKDFEDFLDTACPVVASYGGRARWEQGAADRLHVLLDKALVANDCKEYPEAGHAFMNRHGGFAVTLTRWLGMSYNEEATQDARRRIVAFFHIHLDGETQKTSQSVRS